MKHLQRSTVVAALLLVAAVAATPALGSAIIARNVRHATLTIDRHGRADVSYHAGRRSKVLLAWGAINARPLSKTRPQVEFKLRYGGSTSGVCLPSHGPPLPWLVKACKAPDGSYWALQSWQRVMSPHGGSTGTWELHLSHWRGPLPRLVVHQDWVSGSIRHIFGKLTYRGRGVYGLRSTPLGAPLDGYGRNIYLDTFDSGYGKGWHRENGFLTHDPAGDFCYGFYSPPGRPSGEGTKYRATVEGPGVTPDVMWEANDIGAFNPAVEEQMRSLERSWHDPRCR
jgi:hypothetical protein